jgi:hypothetical protein
MKKLTLLISLFTCFFFFPVSAQIDSCRLQISLLTCTQGTDAYSAFGHTAIRVKDPAINLDRVFNYGTFDDSDPLFYWKFVQGIMNYELSSYDMVYFLREYQYFSRGVTEQVLNLSCEQSHTILDALTQNDLPENRVYQYHFTKNNCTTKSDDAIFNIIGKNVSISNALPEKIPTYRQLLHEYLDEGYQDWMKFGIDLILSSKIDTKVDSIGFRFLPKNLMNSFAKAKIGNQPLVKETNQLLPADTTLFEETSLTPSIVFSVLLMLYVCLSFVQLRWVSLLLKLINFVLYFVLGALGVVLSILWIIRVDEVCENNYNLLWAIPTHLIISFFIFSSKKWVATYFRITMIIAIFTGIFWWFIPQNFNTAVIPILGLIVASSYYISRTIHHRQLK